MWGNVKKIASKHGEKREKIMLTLFPSIPNWKRRIPSTFKNLAFAFGYGSGHRYLHQTKTQTPHKFKHHTKNTYKASQSKSKKRSHDRSEPEAPHELEAAGVGEPRPVQPFVHHPEVRRRRNHNIHRRPSGGGDLVLVELLQDHAFPGV